MRFIMRLCLIQLIGIVIVMAMIFVFLVVLINLPNSTGKDPDFYSLEIEIGDIQGNSSLLIPISSQNPSTVTFYSNEEPFTILLSDHIPSTITDYLPLQQLPLLSRQSESVYRGDFNCLGSDEPIYLLSGSFIEYNLTITLIKSIDTVYPACLYLFTSETHYKNFLMPIQNNYQYNDSHCFFMSEVTQGTAATASHSFEIENAGLYYVGIQLQSGVTVQANASVVQVYYNTTGLRQQANCSSVLICSIDICNASCSHETTTYFLVKILNRTSIYYNVTSLQVKSISSSQSIVIVIMGTLSFVMIVLVCFCTCICIYRKRLSDYICDNRSKWKIKCRMAITSCKFYKVTCLQCLRNRASKSQRHPSSIQFTHLHGLSTENQQSGKKIL